MVSQAPIKDIKDLFTLSDYYILGLIPLLIIIITAAVFFAYKLFKRKDYEYETSMEILKNLDLDNSKRSAYLLTKHGLITAREESEKKLHQDLVKDLERYKYRKSPKHFSQATQEQIKIFLGAVDAAV